MMMWIFSFLVFLVIFITLLCILRCLLRCFGVNMDSALIELSDAEMTMQSDETPGIHIQETSV
jgi:hypothetical protein